MKKKTTVIVLALAAVMSMSACGERDRTGTDSLWENDVRLIDGRTVHCIAVPNQYGFSCDWENAK